MKLKFFVIACVAVVLTCITATKTPVDDSYDSYDEYCDPVATDTDVFRNTRYILVDQQSPLSDPTESSIGSSKFVSSVTLAEFVSTSTIANHFGYTTPTSFPTYAAPIQSDGLYHEQD